MKQSKKDAAVLLGVGAWNIAIWSNFAKNLVRTAKDPEQSRPTPYYVAHGVLVAVDVLIGGHLVKMGAKGLLSK